MLATLRTCPPDGSPVATTMAESSGAHGFGYDPYFYSTELGMTLADATTAEKRRVSHRGRAFDALVGALQGRGVLGHEIR